MTRVSIVVPTFNRLARLRRVIDAIEHLQYPRDQFEVVVVSDGSTDGTHDYMGKLSTPLRLNFIAQKNGGPAAARNTGIRNAQGEYILFIDDDILPTPQLLTEHMSLHDREADVVVLGPMLNPEGFRMSPWVAWEQAMLYKQYSAMEQGAWQASARQFYTGNTSLARRHLVQSGGFDERFRRAEDVELAYRLEQCGVRFVFNQRAIGYHYAERSFRSWLETPYAYGRNDVIFSRERQSWILDLIRSEFKERNRLTQAMVWACLDRPKVSGALIGGLRLLADWSYAAGGERVARAGYSAIFNLRYYQGAADELGGRGRFFAEPSSKTTGAAADH